MTLFLHNAGPMLRYDNGMLEVEDLNPHVQTRWTMTRMEMLRLGLRCILAAIRK